MDNTKIQDSKSTDTDAQDLQELRKTAHEMIDREDLDSFFVLGANKDIHVLRALIEPRLLGIILSKLALEDKRIRRVLLSVGEFLRTFDPVLDAIDELKDLADQD